MAGNMAYAYGETNKPMGITPDIRSRLEGIFSGGKEFTGAQSGQQDGVIAGSQLCTALGLALAGDPSTKNMLQATASKSLAFPTLADPAQLGQKSFWSDALTFLEQRGPAIVRAAMGKEFAAKSPAMQRNMNDPEFKNFVLDLITTYGPLLVQTLNGKDFRPGLAQVNISIPPNKSKNWLSDAFDTVVDTAPIWGPLVVSLL